MARIPEKVHTAARRENGPQEAFLKGQCVAVRNGWQRPAWGCCSSDQLV